MNVVRRNQKSMQSERLFCASARFPIGEIGVACSSKGLREVSIRKTRKSLTARHLPEKSVANGNSAPDGGAALAHRAIAEIAEFLEGRRREFTVPLDLSGTPFQMRVWKALRRIPYGQTRSYADIARAVGRPKAARAVGMANHWNPVAIVVPCHRVVASDGSLGGYAGGLEMKTWLLSLEASTNGSS
jgi:methylated-DNA-[protein]-cysteine S-methyltransferase